MSACYFILVTFSLSAYYFIIHHRAGSTDFPDALSLSLSLSQTHNPSLYHHPPLSSLPAGLPNLPNYLLSRRRAVVDKFLLVGQQWYAHRRTSLWRATEIRRQVHVPRQQCLIKRGGLLSIIFITSDYCLNLHCYTSNVSADMSFSLLQVFHVELETLGL